MRRIHSSSGSKTRPVRRAPPHLQRYTGNIVTSLAQQTRYMEPSLAARWQEIVGPEIAKICWPSRLLPDGQHHSLELIARNGAAATKLNYEAPAILNAVARILGPGTVSRLLIRQQSSKVEAIKPKKVSSLSHNGGTTGKSASTPPQPLREQPQEPSPLASVLEKYRESIERDKAKH